MRDHCGDGNVLNIDSVFWSAPHWSIMIYFSFAALEGSRIGFPSTSGKECRRFPALCTHLHPISERTWGHQYAWGAYLYQIQGHSKDSWKMKRNWFQMDFSAFTYVSKEYFKSYLTERELEHVSL